MFNYFDQKISKASILDVDQEWMVVGKYCRIGIDEDGQIDVWICNHRDLGKGLGTELLRNRLSAIFGCTGTPYTELNGEGCGKLQNKDVILKNLRLLGIRAKRILSEEQKEVLRNRLRKAAAWKNFGAMPITKNTMNVLKPSPKQRVKHDPYN